LFGLAAVNALYFLAHQAFPSVFVLYAGYRYGWGPLAVGLTLAVVGVCTAIVQAGFIHKLVVRFGERRCLVAGLAFGVLSFSIWGFAAVGWLGLMAIPFGSMMGLFGPSAQGLMSKRVSASEQGQLQGAGASIMGITGMMGPAIFTQTFAKFIDGKGFQLPGAPFFLGALLCLMAMLLAWRVTRPAAAEGASSVA
jgi:DHA1 family tetracycline resistance protein-like MFS transporter